MTSTRHGLATLVLVTSALLGCNAIFGLDDLEVVPDGGAQGGAGAGGSGASGGGPCATAADCPAPSTACLAATCEAGACGEAETVLGTACTDGGGKVCDGMGACVECNEDAECATKVCKNGACAPIDCFDGSKNGEETDVDCGGSRCDSCSAGKTCVAGTDCLSGVCTGGTCQVPTCIDGVKNGTETDLDCGGGCPGCLAGKDCLAPEDCQSGVCGGGKCTAPTCSDGVKNGMESDIDCGGTCNGCPVGKACAFGTDCESGLCKASLCALLNGCAPTTAVDLTGMAATTITFGGGGNMFDPPCFKVSAGTTGTKVTFSGNFSAHPLAGGEVVGSQDFPDPTSPFMPVTSGGPDKVFTLGTPGDYPFYCTTHFANGMYGAVFVVP